VNLLYPDQLRSRNWNDTDEKVQKDVRTTTAITAMNSVSTPSISLPSQHLHIQNSIRVNAMNSPSWPNRSHALLPRTRNVETQGSLVFTGKSLFLSNEGASPSTDE
jgi:hypothetical protein